MLPLRIERASKSGIRRANSGISAGTILSAFIAIHILFPALLIDLKAQETPPPAEPLAAPAVQTAHSPLGKPKAREVVLYNGEMKFDINKVPVLGPRDAKYIVLELFCYTCKQCRALHPQMKQAQARYGRENFAIVVLPSPLNIECNPLVVRALHEHRYACSYAEYGLAVAAANMEKFEEFHNWLMTGEQPPLLSAVRAKAYEMVGKENFDTARKSQKVKDWITDGVSIFKHVDADAIPQIITDKRMSAIIPTSVENLYTGLDQMTGLKPVE